MKNVVVQERLFTEPTDNPEEALNFAFAFEQGAQQKKTICVKAANIKEVICSCSQWRSTMNVINAVKNPF